MKATIFDCDGTLVDNEILANGLLVEMIGEQGATFSLQEALVHFRGHKMADCVEKIEARLGRTLPAGFEPDFRTRLEALFRAELQPMEGAVDLVRSLTGSFCIASSGPREKIHLSLTLTGLLPFFEGRIFSAYDISSWKPDPGLFLHAAESMGVEPGDCAVVEDSLPGVQAGIAAGMKVFAFQPHGLDPSMPGEAIPVTRLAQLRELLE